MLIEFRVENYRSLRDEQVLTMEVGRASDDDARPRIVDGYSERLLPLAVLYGANASGKTNVLTALSFMRLAVTDSHRSWGPTEGIPCDPFAWGSKKNEPSTFEVTVLINSVRYEYGFVATDKEFIEEWLFTWPHGKKQTWFEREGNAFNFGENLKGENKLIEGVTRPNALYLSAAAQHRHAQLTSVYTWFSQLRSIRFHGFNSRVFRVHEDPSIARLVEERSVATLFTEEDPSDALLDRFRAMLKNSDIGILGLKVDESEKRLRFHLKHESTVEESWLPLEKESNGTQTLFRMALPILRSLERGGVIIVDELEASLHPHLAQKIIHLFNDQKSNPHNAQLIATTHDTNLLRTTPFGPALRRDQVWFTEKTSEGATVLYPLTDFKPRKSENLERGYLQGRYGAIPFLGNFPFPSE